MAYCDRETGNPLAGLSGLSRRSFSEDGSAASANNMAILPGVLGCSFGRLRTSSPCDVPLKLPAARLVDETCRRAQVESLRGMRSLEHFQVRLGTNPAATRDELLGGTPIFFALAALRLAPHAGSQFRGLATAINEISGREMGM